MIRSRLRFLAVLGSVAGCSPSARVEIQPIGTLSVGSEVQVVARVVDRTGRRDPDALPPVLTVEPPELAALSPGSRLRCLRGGKGLLVATAGVLETRVAFVCAPGAP